MFLRDTVSFAPKGILSFIVNSSRGVHATRTGARENSACLLLYEESHVAKIGAILKLV